ncbi:MAG TPA: sugar phosphate nucleotidyltransferase [Anaerolineales bacterium]|jgi:glucose-1-phosphate thymidylyltransferase|nr:sugar phosphate nucleotidyltransferase [Anaerolineales bacterium]
MSEPLKIFIPMAGWGTRMRPHTWSKPKPLVSVAGKASLEHLLDMFHSIPDPDNVEFVFIVGPYLGELQVPPFIREKYPNMKAHFVVQHEMKGQSHALWLAREFMHGPMMMCFSDTVLETDFSFLSQEEADVVAWVMPMPDPRRFGVAELDSEGWVTRFIEKPESLENNLVVAGCYYFKSAEQLLAAIEEQIKRNLTFKGEFFLTHTISLMIENGAKVRTQISQSWLDTGTIDATLETNKILLSRNANKTENETVNGVEIIAPSFIDPTADIQNSVIGPYASIGANCRIVNSKIEESILEANCEIQDAALSHSLIGVKVRVQGRSDGQVLQLNVGDNSEVSLI